VGVGVGVGEGVGLGVLEGEGRDVAPATPAVGEAFEEDPGEAAAVAARRPGVGLGVAPAASAPPDDRGEPEGVGDWTGAAAAAGGRWLVASSDRAMGGPLPPRT
jgi:hypothetical protein